MIEVNCKIADHFFQISSKSNVLIEFFHNYDWVNKYQYIDPSMSIYIEDGYGRPFANYEVSIIRETNQILYSRADYLIKVDPKYKKAIISVHDELALKHALMNLYSSFIVHHNWGLLIHSSCVVENGKGHIFAGHSGAGKSTAAKLSHPRVLLSDEATIIKINQDSVSVFNSPFRSELEEKGPNEACPLASIQLLQQALHNNRTKIKKSDALLHLIDKVFYWTNSEEETKQVLKLLKELVEKVPVYELYFKKDNKFWELIS